MNKEGKIKRKVVGIKTTLDIQNIERQILSLNLKMEQLKGELSGKRKLFI
jgi:hypothetical protein